MENIKEFAITFTHCLLALLLAFYVLDSFDSYDQDMQELRECREAKAGELK